MEYHLRAAVAADVPHLSELISLSARQLCSPDYSAEQVEAALQGAFGVDSQLIQDGTYFVIEYAGFVIENTGFVIEQAGSGSAHAVELAACGGWSRRATLFGGDARPDRNAALLDPFSQPAKVRAFFVHPRHARRGLGRKLLDACESAARRAGFQRVELMATLTGAKLYAACGYVPSEPISYETTSGVAIQFIPMTKLLEVIPESLP